MCISHCFFWPLWFTQKLIGSLQKYSLHGFLFMSVLDITIKSHGFHLNEKYGGFLKGASGVWLSALNLKQNYLSDNFFSFYTFYYVYCQECSCFSAFPCTVQKKKTFQLVLDYSCFLISLPLPAVCLSSILLWICLYLSIVSPCFNNRGPCKKTGRGFVG